MMAHTEGLSSRNAWVDRTKADVLDRKVYPFFKAASMTAAAKEVAKTGFDDMDDDIPF